MKLSAELSGLSEARAFADRLGELEPAPSASTLFEVPGTHGWRVEAYFEFEPMLEDLRTQLGPGAPAELRLDAVPDENWVAISQAALPPVEAGRYIVHGSHDRARVGRRLGAIEIDAGEAFGTAHHATTLGCLMALDRLTRRRAFGSVLDLGSGSGVLAIAAAIALPGARIVASDIDPVAVEVAVGNFGRNRVAGRIRAVAATGLAHPRLRGARRYDLIVANILAGPLILLAQAIAGAVIPRGVVVLSGILGEQANEVTAAYVAAGFRVARRQTLNGWATLVLERRP